MNPLGAEDSLNGKSNVPHEEHEARVTRRIQITDDMLDVRLGRDEGFPAKGGPPIKEGDVVLVLVAV